MSAERMPSRSEVMGWGPQQLADYLKRMNLSGCDKVVLKNCISGSRFVNLSDNDLQKFPKLHAPLISKLSTEISRKEERRGLFSKKTTPKYHEPEMAADVQVWGDDEFDEEFDDDYESPCSGDDEDSIGDYETPSDDVANDYEPPPSEPLEDFKLRPTLPIGDSEYIDSRNNHAQCPPPVVSPRPPVSTLSTPSPQRVGDSRSSQRDPSPRSSARPAGNFPLEPPQIFRHNKPGQTIKSSPSPSRGLHNNTLDRPSARSWKPQSDATDHSTWPKPSLPATSNFSVKVPPKPDMNREQQTFDGAVKHNTFPLHVKGNFPCPGRPAPPSCQGNSLPPNMSAPGSLSHKLQTAVAEQKGGYGGPPERQSFRPPPSATSCTQELNPCWYVGKVTRGQAEGCLKQVHKDGAYLVRDSTRQLPSQPFTLMVFYQDKVYNIQIRQENQQFQLGTGLKLQEFFSSVGDIIGHYSQSPLLLIDAKNRSSGQQNQCLLSDPAGYYMTGQKWT